MERSAGVLMHISSLPGKFGIGTFGKEAYKFADFLNKAGMKYWQLLPVGHTSYGDSPYQCFSAFAGNPYFIDFDKLVGEGLLEEKDYIDVDFGVNKTRVDYALIFESKYKVLKVAYSNFSKKGKFKELKEEFKKFEKENKFWLEDYALYMAVKNHFDLKSWSEWDDDIKKREPEALAKYKKELKDDIEYWSFLQFLFFKQWYELKAYANDLGIEFIGDIPIYVAYDSCDTWSHPENFQMDMKKFEPTVVAGCPPDAFSETGQLWGNVIYDWDKMKKDKYTWWVSRVRESLKLYDVLRIDHFRGFEAYWAIPYGDDTAINGKWVKGPAMSLFKEIKKQLGDINVIAEDLGFLTDEVIDFLRETGYPGMKILQFAFNGEGDNDYLPQNYGRNCIAYTGTHDNDTFVGWFTESSSTEEATIAKTYLGLNSEEGYNWGFIRGVWSSVADVAIAPMQDFLNLGAETRMNTPSTTMGNWQWRAEDGSFDNALADKIYEMNILTGRFFPEVIEEDEDEEEEEK